MFSPWADDPSNFTLLKALYDSTQEEQQNALDKAKFYYQFEFGRCKFFVMDVRGERELLATQYKKLPNDYREPRMIGCDQKKALMEFLEEKNDTDLVKFIVTPVPFFPDYTGCLSKPADIWTGYAEQRMEILESIGEIADQQGNDFTRPIFLSGDVHHSLVAKLTIKTNLGKKLDLYSVISSAFNWYIFGLQRMSLHKQGKKSNLISHWRRRRRYKIENDMSCEIVTDVEKRNCYTIISVYGKKVKIERIPVKATAVSYEINV
jgi:hypothetical protein